MINETLYFAYGANMCRDELTKRVGEPEFVGVGKLRDYRLAFNREGSFRPGGVASVVPVEGSHVYGIVWRLNEQQMMVLDAIENMVAYGRFTRAVEIDGIGLKECDCYITYPKGDFTPGQAYLDIILKAAREHAFPDHYIQDLMAHAAVN